MKLQTTLEAPPMEARTYMSGQEAVTIGAGKRINIRYWAPGELNLLDATVPKGKVWTVTVAVSVVETDV